MKKLVILFIILLSSINCIFSQEKYTLDSNDYKALKVCDGVINLFKQNHDEIWSGYDLSRMPFLFYMPDKWSLVFNYKGTISDFQKYPDDWPDLGTDVQIHFGKYKDLAGQLAFSFKVDTLDLVAIPFPFQNYSVNDLFGFVVHEAFHQYQHYTFGEISWQREERYPIQDSVNTSLAYIEMKLVMDAYRDAVENELSECKELVKMFVVVRDFRWKQNSPYLYEYEQGLEINEGTAKYVEVKSLLLLNNLITKGFSETKNPDILLNEFNSRVNGNSISSENMPRNRVYFVGSTEGLLLDYFGIKWKELAQKAGPDFAFYKLMSEYLNLDSNEYGILLEKAKDKYGYKDIVSSSSKLIKQYVSAFDEEMKNFEMQDGYKFEINVSVRSVSRSASTSEKKLVVENGVKELCKKYNIFSIKGKNYLLQVRNAGILQENDYKNRAKKITFFTSEVKNMKIDGLDIRLDDIINKEFENIEIENENLLFNANAKGSIMKSGKKIGINLVY